MVVLLSRVIASLGEKPHSGEQPRSSEKPHSGEH